MPYKVIKEAEAPRKYCDYIEKKFEIARKHNTVYDLTDEDIRIQKLYDNPDLKPVEKIRSIARVKREEDGQEAIVVSKTVQFFHQVTKLYKDSYSTHEGITEIPLRTTNEDGVTEATQTQLDYHIPFSKELVNEYIKKSNGRPIKFKFYYGPMTSSRMVTDAMIVGNQTMFTDATWEELELGREKKLISSRLNKLEEIRNDIPIPPQGDVNKVEERTTIIDNVSGEGEQTTFTESTIKVKNPTQTRKNA